MKTWRDQHLRRGMDNFKIESFQLADALWKLLSKLDFGLSNDSWIEDQSHIFGTLYYRDIFKCIQFLLAHLPFQVHFDLEPMCLADAINGRVYSKMNTGDCWWDTQDQLPAWVTIVPVICVSDKTHLTNFSGNQHAWPLYLTIGNMRKDICRTPKKRVWIHFGLIPWPPKGAKNTEEAWHSAVATVLSPLRNLDITDSQNNSWLLQSHMAHARCVKFLKVRRGDIPLFNHSITEEIRMFARTCWRKLIWIFCTLLVFIQSATCSGNSLSAIISNNSSFRLKHLGVPDGSDGSDGALYTLTGNYTLHVTQVMGHVA